MQLKGELHRIIGVCAAVTFVVIGAIAFQQVRRFHREEYVEARGIAMSRVLAPAVTKALEGPNPEGDLEDLLRKLVETNPETARGLDVVSAVVYDRHKRPVGAQIGGTTSDHDPNDPHITKAFQATDPRAVLIQPGDPLQRFSKEGEEIVEFALPLINGKGDLTGVIVFSLARGGARYSFVRTIVVMLVGAAIVIALLWFALYKMVDNLILAPILKLSEGIKQVRGGDLSVRVGIYRRDEIGILVESFNDLIAVLVERDSLQARLEEANRLAEAHRRLNEAHRQLKEAQEQLILTEKHASLGRLVHGLNHELNNPLSAAQNMIPPLKVALDNLREALLPPPPAPTVEPEVAPSLEESDEGSLASSDTATVGETGEPALPDAVTEAELDPARSDSGRLAPPPLDPSVREDLEDATQAVEVLARSVLRAINIVRDLGEFSRLTTADLERVELQAVVDEALTACQPDLGGNKISVSVDVPEVEGEPLRLKAFPHLLGQVFVNLISNSAQAMEGSGKIRIWARLVGSDRVRIELDDNGPGIPKDHLDKVFEPFFTTKEPGQGTGLGLSICLGVIEKHGGTIEARKRWRGAHFVIELPLEPVVEANDPRASTNILSGSTLAPSA